jgi:hypothetical protein
MLPLLLALAACGSQGVTPTHSVENFSLPTQIPTNTLPAIPTLDVQSDQPELKRPTPTPICTNSLWFLADVTIPDGTAVEPGELLDKRWEVRNNGTCNWNEYYQVRLIAGPSMGLPAQQALYPALSGIDIVIRMVFIAPDEPGNYRSAWQAYDPLGNSFGDPFFIDVVVPEEPVTTPESGE